MFNKLTGLKLEISFLSGLPLSNGTTVATFAFSRFYFERNGQRISHWADPNLTHQRSPHFYKKKMECIGFKESVIKWFQSYLSNRKFFVTLENVFSVAGIINCGVPQGTPEGRSSF